MSLYDSTSLYDASTLSFDGYGAPLANMPAVGVYIAWTGTPYEFDPTGGWTDITRYVRGINIRRGRQDDLQQFPPGTASLVLDNRDRLFDPFNTAGANYANLKPRKQIKIVANWAGVEYPLYRGYVAGWPVEYTEAGLDSTVTIDCFDLLGLLGATDSPAEWMQTFITRNPPRLYYKCDDNIPSQQYSGTTEIDPYITDYSGNNLHLNGLTGKGQAGGVNAPGCLGKGIDAANGQFANQFLPYGFRPAQTFSDYTLTAFITISPTLTSYYFNVVDGIRIVVQWGPTLVISVGFDTGAGQEKQLTFSTIKADNTPHHVAVTVEYATQTVTFYWDGVQQTPSSTTSVYYDRVNAWAFAINNAALQQIITYRRILTAAEILLIYKLGMGQLSETANARVTRIFNETSVPTAMIDNQLSSTLLVSQLNNESTILAELQKVADSQDGDVYISDSGLVTLIGQDYLFGQTRCNTSQMTFTDTGVGIDYVNEPVRMTLDADTIRNSINVGFSKGGAYSVTDSTSIAAFGVAGETINTVIASSDDAQSIAQQRLAIYKNPKLRIEPFMAKGQQDPSYNWPRLLALELLDRVTFKRTPAVGSAVQRDLLVQSIEHRITPGEWQTVVNGSTRYTGWFILGVSLLGSSEDVLL